MTLLPLPSEPTWPYYTSPSESAFVRVDELDDEAKVAYLSLKGKLTGRLQKRNQNLMDRYEDSHRVQSLDIAIPPNLVDLHVAAGMQATGVDVLAEKLRWNTYISAGGDLLGLDELAIQSQIRLEVQRAQQEALITGVGFCSVGAGNPFNYEPDVLVTAESPLDATVFYDRRQRRITQGYVKHVNAHGVIDQETLYLLNRNIYIERSDGGELRVVDVDEHGANHCFLRPLFNRGRATKLYGATDLSRAARYYADAAVRTLLGMEINREFYTTPQRWLMGADMSMFKDKDGKQVSTWQAVAGLMLAAPAPVLEDDETGDLTYGPAPKVGQFQAAPPQPYIDQGKDYRLAFATTMGFPAFYLGYMAGENPASADAIRAGAQRLTDTTINRQDGFTYDHRELALAMLIVRDGRRAITPALLTELRKIGPDWADPSPDTTAADTDSVVKLTGIGMMQPDSPVAMKRAGLNPVEIAQVQVENRAARSRARAAERAALVAARAAGTPPTPPAPGDTPPTPDGLPAPTA